MRRPHVVSLAVLLLVIVLTACTVTSFTGTTTVAVGQQAAYDIAIQGSGPGTAEVYVDVPDGWVVSSATYTGSEHAQDAAGTATVTPGASTSCSTRPAEGYQRVRFAADFPNGTSSDLGTLHVVFVAGGLPGTYTLKTFAAGIAQGDTAETCSDATPHTLDVNVVSGVAKSFSPAAIATGQTSTLTVILNNAGVSAATGVAFTDSYPSGVVNAAAPNVTSSCGGVVTATPGSGTLQLSGGAIAADGTCTVTTIVTAATVGSFTNTLPAGAVTTSNGTFGAAASATLVVGGHLATSKTFAPTTVLQGGNSVLTITITNPNADTLTGVTFTDALPSGMVIASSPNASSTCGGTVTANPGGNSLQLSGGQVGGSRDCTVTATVTAVGSGILTNTIAANTIATAGGTNNLAASATLTSLAPPAVAKSFSPPTIAVNGASTLTITLTNSNASSATGVSFTDSVPVGLTVSGNASTTCGGSATASGSTIQLSGGTIPANGSCTVTAVVTGATPGSYTNTINAGAVSGSSGSNTSPASATLTVLVPPSTIKALSPSSIAVNGASTLTITLTNTNATSATGASFTDSLPVGLSVSGSASTTCGGSATASGNTVQLSGGTIPANGSCTVTAVVTGATPGTYTNTIKAGAVSGSTGSNATAASATLTILTPPTVMKNFSPNLIAIGGTSTVTITLSNTNSTPGTAASFVDTLPSGVFIAATPNASSTCGGTVTAPANGSTLQLSGGAIPANGSCTVTAAVTSSVAGAHTNTIPTGGLTSSAGSNASSASADLTVLTAPGVAKAFAPSTIASGGTSTLTITLANPNVSAAATGAAFTDTLPAGMVVASAPNATTSCGGIVTANAGTNVVQLSGGTIAASGQCAVSVAVTSSTPGVLTNTIPAGALTSSAGTNANTASATLTVLAPPTVAKSFSPAAILTRTNSTLTVTLTNPNATPLTGAAFTDTYPAGLVNAAVPNAGSTCGGTVTAAANGNSIALTNGIIPANGSCTVTVLITANDVGTYQNTIAAGGVTTSNSGANATAASATLIATPFNAVPALDARALAALAIALAAIGAFVARRT